MVTPKKIVIVAGDKSGDLYGGLLCKKLKEKFSNIKIFSFGGDFSDEYSQQIINLVSHSVSGIGEVIYSFKNILAIFKKTLKEIKKINPHLIILIDFPDFNLRLAKNLNKRYPLFYYVSPQVWAWRKGRINLIKKYVDKMIVIFRFEKDFYAKMGINVLYFGHPLLEIVKKRNLKPKNIISFLPGSRKNEIKKHLPIIEKAKNIIKNKLNNYSFQIIRPPHIEEAFYKNIGVATPLILHSYEVIEQSKFVITSSGTATLEIALLEIPFITIYRVNSLTWHIAKILVNTEFIGMVNILASEKIVDELLQKEVNPENIARVTLSYLEDKDKYEKLKGKLKIIKEKLSPYNATERLADFIGKYLELS
jgi:lipid-A-disaccharide synthase